jgi:Tfp pilus assembly protein PilO
MNSKWTDLAFKILSVLVIPVLGWAISLQVSQAVQNEKIARLETEVQAAKAIKDGVVANTNTLGRMEEKLDGTNRRLDEIRADLRRSLPPDNP